MKGQTMGKTIDDILADRTIFSEQEAAEIEKNVQKEIAEYRKLESLEKQKED